MAKFTVEVREVHISHVQVEAETREEAVANVKGGEGDELNLEYSNTLDKETWAVVDADKTYYYNGTTGKFDKTL